MKLTSKFTLLLCLALPLTVLAQGPGGKKSGLELTMGAGLISAPTYLGDDEYQISAFPNISLAYGNRLKASMRGIEYLAISLGGFQAGPVLAYDFGREEFATGPFAISGEDSTDLVGLGDIEGTMELGGFIGFEAGSFAMRVEARNGVAGGHEGVVGNASISYRKRLSAFGTPLFLSIGPEITFGDDAYNSTFFDVSATQSIASGISEFDATGSLNSTGLRLLTMVPLTKNTSVVGFVNYDQLDGDIGDSTIVTERGSEEQITTGFFINFKY